MKMLQAEDIQHHSLKSFLSHLKKYNVCIQDGEDVWSSEKVAAFGMSFLDGFPTGVILTSRVFGVDKSHKAPWGWDDSMNTSSIVFDGVKRVDAIWKLFTDPLSGLEYGGYDIAAKKIRMVVGDHEGVIPLHTMLFSRRVPEEYRVHEALLENLILNMRDCRILIQSIPGQVQDVMFRRARTRQ